MDLYDTSIVVMELMQARDVTLMALGTLRWREMPKKTKVDFFKYVTSGASL